MKRNTDSLGIQKALEEDRKAEDEILRRLDNGDVWAWACVTVKARYHLSVDGFDFEQVSEGEVD